MAFHAFLSCQDQQSRVQRRDKHLFETPWLGFSSQTFLSLAGGVILWDQSSMKKVKVQWKGLRWHEMETNKNVEEQITISFGTCSDVEK